MIVKNDFLTALALLNTKSVIVPASVVRYKKQVFYYGRVMLQNKKITILIQRINICISKIPPAKTEKELYVFWGQNNLMLFLEINDAFYCWNVVMPQCKKQRFFCGLSAGLSYFLVLLAVSFVINKGLTSDTAQLLTTLAFCVGSGIIGGVSS